MRHTLCSKSDEEIEVVRTLEESPVSVKLMYNPNRTKVIHEMFSPSRTKQEEPCPFYSFFRLICNEGAGGPSASRKALLIRMSVAPCVVHAVINQVCKSALTVPKDRFVY